MTDDEPQTAPEPETPPRLIDDTQSAEIGKLAEALAKAQAKLEQPSKNKTATIKMKAGGQYSYKYADLPAVIECLKGGLAENGLSYVQPMRIEGDRLILVTRLMHASGQWISSEWPLKVSPDPKETASMLTYGRRYSLTSLCGISAEETDDDAERRGSGKTTAMGSLTKTALQKKMREFNEELVAVTDEDQLIALLGSTDYSNALVECERELPSWYYTQEGSDQQGITDRIAQKRREVRLAEAGPA